MNYTIKDKQQFKDLSYTLANQLWRLISGPLMLLFIPLFLKPEQQGYWYLFGSISTLSFLADLGFTGIVLQFSAHEYAFLSFSDRKLLEGDELHLKKLGSFFRFILKWVFKLCIITFPIIYIVGFVFFTRDGVLNIYWLPWTLYTLGSTVNFFINFVLSFIEGLDKVASIQKIRLITSVLNTGIVTLILFSGGNIYALAFSILISSFSIFFMVILQFLPILKELLNVSSGFYYNWKSEIVPLFTRYVIGGFCGYFVFNIYIPIMHYFHGPVYSGKVGISLSLVMSLLSISSIWIYTIVPKINMFISKKEWKELDLLFNERMKLSLGTYFFGLFSLFILLCWLKDFRILPKIISRFLSFESIVILFCCYFFQLIINNMAIYLRAHKREPLMWQAILAFLWIVPTTIFVGKYFSPAWFFSGFLSSYIFLMPINLLIFFKCKKNWHSMR